MAGKAKAKAETEEEKAIGPRNFRHSSDIENFYRFVFDNELRNEAHKILDFVLKCRKKSKRRSKSLVN